jgi:soluble epoxide hydrolase / lipid-phosphate phosphatase
LLHGWPDDAFLWEKIVSSLKEVTNPLLIPDLLGYSGTSKPVDAAKYSSKAMADDLLEILDHENIKSVISTGHDWGSFLAQRFYLFHPDRCAGVMLLNVAYMPPGADAFDMDQANAMTEQMTGHPRLAYWELFCADDGSKVMEEHLDSVFHMMHGEGKDQMLKTFCVRGATREWVEKDTKTKLKPYAADGELQKRWVSRMQKDGLTAPAQWYYAMKDNHQYNAEKELVPDKLVIKVPLLYIGCTDGKILILMDLLYLTDQIPRRGLSDTNDIPTAASWTSSRCHYKGAREWTLESV